VDRERYLERLAHYREKFDFRLLAFCLMTNHGKNSGKNRVRLHEDGGPLSAVDGDEIVVGAERRWPRCCR